MKGYILQRLFLGVFSIALAFSHFAFSLDGDKSQTLEEAKRAYEDIDQPCKDALQAFYQAREEARRVCHRYRISP